MGADLLVRGAVALARRARVSPLLVAATVVALGTSLPELVVALQAAFTGYPGLVIGNVVGSNIANVLLVGGVTAVICPLSTEDSRARRDTLFMMAITIAFVAMCLAIPVHRLAGLLLLSGLAALWGVALRDAATDRDDSGDTPLDWVLGIPSTTWMIALFITLGCIGLPLGANLVVDAAVVIASSWGVSEAIVGLSLLAFSTSLPELATSVIAALQGRTEVAVGTLVGSNMLNLLAIMGLTGLLSPTAIPIPPGLTTLDLPLMVLSALLLACFVWFRRPIGRIAGITMTTVYTAYIVIMFVVR